MNDLGLDSLDQVEIIMAIEDEFGKEVVKISCVYIQELFVNIVDVSTIMLLVKEGEKKISRSRKQYNLRGDRGSVCLVYRPSSSHLLAQLIKLRSPEATFIWFSVQLNFHCLL